MNAFNAISSTAIPSGGNRIMLTKNKINIIYTHLSEEEHGITVCIVT
jgi:hypothetical protein